MQPSPIADTLMPEEPSERVGKLFALVICLSSHFRMGRRGVQRGGILIRHADIGEGFVRDGGAGGKLSG
jgi:hypothetical protein